ncbi:MAG TPA: 3-methyl-2-oxobutanoate hydroxymethyltransferase [Bryobacteraceae bacterium]|nr:3-methyl-2-oxobutanoate hydroxymethyltransferase [Bryobacteraceae bacterium]
MNEQAEKIWPPRLRQMKQRGEKIVMLTAYDALMARLLDRAGIDVVLVGDSLGMVLLGYRTTLPVTLEAMIHHTQAVSRGVERALIVADMPFLTFQVNVSEAIRNAGRLLQEGGANAVKIEGPAIATTAALVEAGIPVMGHLGLLPQSVNRMGGFHQQAKSDEEAFLLIENAKALEKAGAFAIVLESIPAKVAQCAASELSIPAIGIGAGPHCDGQVLVSYDAFGLTEGPVPSFAKAYAKLGAAISEAAKAYAEEVRNGVFP